jgi:NAD(P)-dependent dehydrogenase (short-subunit alcohol dehydrogenase family)
MDQLIPSPSVQEHTDDSLAGRTVLVTGGASGLGAALCRMLAASGANVVIGDLDLGKSEAMARSVAENCSDGATRLHALGFDVADPEGAQHAVAAAIERFGTLDVLINNAGTDVTLPMSELTPEQWLPT